MWSIATKFPSNNQLSVTATLASPMHYEKRNAFFRDLFKPFQLSGYSFLRTSTYQSKTCGTSSCIKDIWFSKFTEDVNEFQNLKRRFFGKLIENPEEAIQQYPLIASIIRERLSVIHYRQIRISEDSEYYKIPCFPGYQKLFLDVNGAYYPCERTERSPNYQLGTVESGFDAQKAILLMDKFRDMADCVQCEARYLCELCYAELHECCEGTFDRKDYETRCNIIRNSVRKDIADYIFLAEFDPNILEYLCGREIFEDEVLIPRQKKNI
jgi:radical SAM protein with 4Fe4S-binding SPASM domain